MKDSFIFYKSFYDAIMQIEDEKIRLQSFEALTRYALEGIESPVEGIAGVVFALVKPQIDANKIRYENGCKGAKFGKLGGRPKKDPPAEEKPQEDPKKPKKDKPEKHKFGEFQHVLLTQDEYDRLVADRGAVATDEAIKFFDEYIEDKGYKTKSHNMALRRWVFDAVEDKKRKQNKAQATGTVDDYFAGRGVI